MIYPECNTGLSRHKELQRGGGAARVGPAGTQRLEARRGGRPGLAWAGWWKKRGGQRSPPAARDAGPRGRRARSGDPWQTERVPGGTHGHSEGQQGPTAGPGRFGRHGRPFGGAGAHGGAGARSGRTGGLRPHRPTGDRAAGLLLAAAQFLIFGNGNRSGEGEGRALRPRGSLIPSPAHSPPGQGRAPRGRGGRGLAPRAAPLAREPRSAWACPGRASGPDVRPGSRRSGRTRGSAGDRSCGHLPLPRRSTRKCEGAGRGGATSPRCRLAPPPRPGPAPQLGWGILESRLPSALVTRSLLCSALSGTVPTHTLTKERKPALEGTLFYRVGL
ncbi:collagen alpha-1(I) chain-like [Cavia porcellus]|uniref:collagen alpha-1(I) chain-like n=1 Tax=Cavia porcellus TaxID=10141 RepID=UPI002FE36C17